MKNRRRVVITGIGWVTPLGCQIESVWKAMQAGRSGVDYITHFDATGFPTKIAGEVKDFEFAYEEKVGTKFYGRNAAYAITAAHSAFEDAGIEVGQVESERMGVYLGAGEGAMDFFHFVHLVTDSWRDNYVDTANFLAKGSKLLHPVKEFEQKPFMPGAHIANIFRARGPNSNCLTACAASSQAVGEATEIIRRGDADVMISGGAHSMIHPFGLAGFNLLTALSTRNDAPQKASRPFDRMRDGFILGEGSGILILEELAHARERGARIYGEIIGYGSTCDAFRITDQHPEGRGAITAIRASLADAGLGPDAPIDYINAHGTSTGVNDKVETLAIKKVFGEKAYQIPISSLKSMVGHLIAAAGAVELISTLLAMRDGIVPPTINYENPDPDCDLDYVPNEARGCEVKMAMSNSFGFGGQNVTLTVRRFED